MVGARPWLVLDCAHNPASARALAAALGEYLEYDALTLVIGIALDKDAAGVTSLLCPLADRVIVTAARNPRALSPAQLLAVVRQQWDGPAVAVPAVSEALDLARQTAAERDAICVTGSFLVVGEAMEYLGLEA